MLVDSYDEVRRLAANKINLLRGRTVNYYVPNEDFVGDCLFKDADKNDHLTSGLPKTNLDAENVLRFGLTYIDKTIYNHQLLEA